MTGPYDSVIGVEAETIVKRFVTGHARALRDRQGRPALRGGGGDRGRRKTGRATAIDRMLIAEGDVESL